MLLKIRLESLAEMCIRHDIDFDYAYKSVVDTKEKGVLVVDTQDAHFPKKLLNIKQKDPNKPLTDRDVEENYLGEGVGTELKLLLSRYLGIRTSAGCKCNQHAQEMNQKGVQWCESNKETILRWLQEESKKKKLPFIRTAAFSLISIAIYKYKRRKAKES